MFSVVEQITKGTRIIRGLALASVLFGLTLGVNAIQISTLWVSLFSRRQVLLFNATLAYGIWKWMVITFEYFGQAKVTFTGDALPLEENAIVVANHLTWTDVFVIHSLSIRQHMLQNCKYFAKDSLKYFPAIGWGMYLMGMIFIKRQWNNDRGSIEKTFQTIKTTKVPAWIISYLEGSRQTPEKLHDSQVYAAKKGLPVLKNVMLPRTKGFVATVNAFRNTHIKAVYDLTIAYKHDEKGFQAFPSVINLHTTPLKGYHFNIHVRRFLIADLPEDEEELSQWVINMWKEKDEILEYMKTNWTDGLPMVDLPSPLWKSATREESRPLLASA